jgi:uncharacterized membrane protein YsdA (DUF1294 family)
VAARHLGRIARRVHRDALFHHKTSKTSFQIVFWVIVVAQVGLIAFLSLRG